MVSLLFAASFLMVSFMDYSCVLSNTKEGFWALESTDFSEDEFTSGALLHEVSSSMKTSFGDGSIEEELISLVVLGGFTLSLYSFLIGVSSDLVSSLPQLWLELFFSTWFIFYTPDIFLHGYKAFINKVTLSYNVLILYFLLYVEAASQFIKSCTLSLSLNTNFLAGHMLYFMFIVLFDFSCVLSLSPLYFFNSLFLFFLFLVEVLVIFIQFYVVIALSALYVEEVVY